MPRDKDDHGSGGRGRVVRPDVTRLDSNTNSFFFCLFGYVLPLGFLRCILSLSSKVLRSYLVILYTYPTPYYYTLLMFYLGRPDVARAAEEGVQEVPPSKNFGV